MSRPAKNIGLLSFLIALFCVATVKLFGSTVSSKFQMANASVVNYVILDDGPSTPAPARRFAAPVLAAEQASEPPPNHTPTSFDAVSTFAIDVDTGSYTHARRAIEGGWFPDAGSVRVEEFVNYFPYAYGPPERGKVAAVHFEVAPSPFATDPQMHLLRIGVRARDVAKREPVHITFLVDTSGSMDSPDRLPLAKEAMRTVVRQLRDNDRIAIATYAGASNMILESTPVRQRRQIQRAIDALEARGGTAMSSGMELAYDVAVEGAGGQRVSHVFVLSDGDANIGSVSAGDILDQVRARVAEGVTLSTVGFGTGNYNDALMEQLADAGNGNYTYIDSADEVPLVFAERLDSLLHVVARDVKIQVDFDADAVLSWRQIGFDNRQLADSEFRDDRADAGELGAGRQMTALYEVQLRDDLSPAAPLATVGFRHKEAGDYTATESRTTVLAGTVRRRIGDASSDFRFQAAVAAFGQKLARRDCDLSWAWIEEVAAGAVDGRAERLRFVQLVRRAAVIEPQDG